MSKGNMIRHGDVFLETPGNTALVTITFSAREAKKAAPVAKFLVWCLDDTGELIAYVIVLRVYGIFSDNLVSDLNMINLNHKTYSIWACHVCD